jgi:hypothetical protein
VNGIIDKKELEIFIVIWESYKMLPFEAVAAIWLHILLNPASLTIKPFMADYFSCGFCGKTKELHSLCDRKSFIWVRAMTYKLVPIRFFKEVATIHNNID